MSPRATFAAGVATGVLGVLGAVAALAAAVTIALEPDAPNTSGGRWDPS